ncbi:MAG TPA: hypothetical protein VMT58_09460, partial [Candidatus Binataceae bacterium]|nr:hypothetical protein [Candidatus Binataceae bacterium]
LKALLIVSEVKVSTPDETPSGDGWAARYIGEVNAANTMKLVGRRAPGIKCQRCWCYFDDGGHPELCPRCRTVLGVASTA